MKRWLLLLLLGAPVLANRTTTPAPALPKDYEPVPMEMVVGCPACCGRITIPKDATIEQAVRECFRRAPKECRDACRGWLREQKKAPRPKKEDPKVRSDSVQGCAVKFQMTRRKCDEKG